MKLSIGIDKNGNKILKIGGVEGLRGFSIQTNGNLPSIHCLGAGAYAVDAVPEIVGYVLDHGTEHQLMLLDSKEFFPAIRAFFKRMET